jgi:hypothetical protein
LTHSSLVFNEDLAKLRNALAHGRAFYFEICPPYKTMFLLKFSRPINKKTKVEYIEFIKGSWFDKNIKWTQHEYKKVIKACNIITKVKL